MAAQRQMFVGYLYGFLVFLEHLFEERRQPLTVGSLKIRKDDNRHWGVDIAFVG